MAKSPPKRSPERQPDDDEVGVRAPWPRRRSPRRRRGPGAGRSRSGSGRPRRSSRRCPGRAGHPRIGPATSASSGSVQSISTTWTPTSSACSAFASSAARATIGRSVRPPDSATTARRNCGAAVSATNSGASALGTTCVGETSGRPRPVVARRHDTPRRGQPPSPAAPRPSGRPGSATGTAVPAAWPAVASPSSSPSRPRLPGP